ncbi:MAG: aminomethyl-transferring glycine dehydrogenase subunit GcvPA, partial [Candidatus Limnocylindrales bacterium]
LACSEALVRQIPGRLVGRTTDLQGRRAFVMTLRAREQDIRRERAASNICTNQALCALAATVYVACLGPHGLRDVAALGAARGRELERALARIGASRVHRAPYLNEFAVRVPDAPAVHERLLARGVLAGLPLARWYPDDGELRDALLVCATEVTTARDIDRFAEALASELGTTGLLRDAAGTAGAAR